MTVAGVDHRVAERLRVLAQVRLDPHRFHAEGRIARREAVQRAEHAAGIDGELAVGMHHALADGHAGQPDAIGVRAQLQVVADVHGLHQEAELLRELAADAADAGQQVAALGAIDQRHQAIADFEADRVHRTHVFPGQFLRSPATAAVAAVPARLTGAACCRFALLHEAPRAESAQRRDRQERDVGHARE